MSMGTFLEEAVLNAVFNNTVGPFPVAQPYVKLHVGDPGEDGASNAAANTTRKALSCGASSGAGAISNDAALDWTNVPNAEDYTHVSIWDADSAGNHLWNGTMTANAVGVGDNFQIPIGDLDITLD